VGEVFVIAVVAALDAGLLAAAVVMLGRPRPARQLLAYLIGGMTFSIIIGLLIVFALRGSSVLRGPDKSTRAFIEVAAGALLIVIAAAVLSGRRAQWHPRRSRKRRHRASAAEPPERCARPRLTVGSRGLPVPPTAGPARNTWPASRCWPSSTRHRPRTSARSWGSNVVMFALIELPVLGLALLPDRTQALTEKLNTWMTSHRRTLIVIVAGAGGAYLLISGLIDLLTLPTSTRHSSPRISASRPRGGQAQSRSDGESPPRGPSRPRYPRDQPSAAGGVR
jgi:hypothetical protein